MSAIQTSLASLSQGLAMATQAAIDLQTILSAPPVVAPPPVTTPPAPPVVDPVPAPVPATPVPATPVPVDDWRTRVEGYRTRDVWAEAQAVAGSVAPFWPDVVPKIMLDGGSTPVNVAAGNRVDIVGFKFRAPAGKTLATGCLDVDVGGAIALRYAKIDGPFGQGFDKVAMGIRHDSVNDVSGRIELVEDFHFEGHESDGIKIAPAPGRTSVIRRGFYGQRMPVQGSKSHGDFITTNALSGDLLVEEVLLDQVGDPARYGDNNGFRVIPDTVRIPSFGTIKVRRLVWYRSDFASKAVQIATSAEYQPKMDFEECFVPWSAIGGASGFFYPGFPFQRLRWVNNRDVDTGDLIPAPAGAASV